VQAFSARVSADWSLWNSVSQLVIRDVLGGRMPSCGFSIILACEAVIVGSGRHSGSQQGFPDLQVFGI